MMGAERSKMARLLLLAAACAAGAQVLAFDNGAARTPVRPRWGAHTWPWLSGCIPQSDLRNGACAWAPPLRTLRNGAWASLAGLPAKRDQEGGGGSSSEPTSTAQKGGAQSYVARD